MIELKNICVTFNNTPIFNNLSVRVEHGDFISIIGANGAGKSTLFSLISGAITPQKGAVFIDNNDVTDLSEYERAPLIARLFQNPLLNTINAMSVAENLALATFKGRPIGLRNAMRSLPLHTIEQILNPLHNNIDHLLTKPMSSLSGGQRQMIALVMATLHPPKILLLDEPTAALDPQTAVKVMAFTTTFIKQHAITTLLITHDQQLATTVGNKLWLLQNGRITQEVVTEA